jgi:putative glutamine amidotransferase
MALIAVTSCRKLEDYRQSVLHAGGDVRIIDPSMPVAEALAGIDGLLFTGGGDIAPARYGETQREQVEDVDPARDQFEIDLIAAAGDRDLPIFAICRGIQVLNVAAGGALVQDIPSQVPGALNHCLAVPPHQPSGWWGATPATSTAATIRR